jgi:hypothetical protein
MESTLPLCRLDEIDAVDQRIGLRERSFEGGVIAVDIAEIFEVPLGSECGLNGTFGAIEADFSVRHGIVNY